MRDAFPVLFAAVLLAPVLLGPPACNTLWGVDELDYAAAGGAAGTAGTGGEGGDTTSSGTGGQLVCEHALVPARPGSTSVDQVDPLVFAVKTITFSGDALGLDVDGTCTCQGEDSSCEPVDPGQDLCDGLQGRDNAALALFSALGQLFTEPLDSFFTAGSTGGDWSVLLEVSYYSGEPNDDSVEVTWYLSPGVPGTANQPEWDGNDTWLIAADSLVGGEPLYVDGSAYVAAGQLVASLPQVHLRMERGQARLPVFLSEMQLVAELGPADSDPASWSLTNGVIAGLISEKDAFDMISGLRNEAGQPICTDTPEYGWGKGQLCNSRDVLTGSGEPDSLCDGWSFGIGFDAYSAVLGNVATSPSPTGCGAAVDPANDSCQ